ncbi:unnamed protein product [Peniophora sp. CBMAI 1063]|nr:unnamed protein product [Peniophora sp. CBMAI 1063]
MECATLAGKSRNCDAIAYLEPVVQLRCIDWCTEVAYSNVLERSRSRISGCFACEAGTQAARGLPIEVYQALHATLGDWVQSVIFWCNSVAHTPVVRHADRQIARLYEALNAALRGTVLGIACTNLPSYMANAKTTTEWLLPIIWCMFVSPLALLSSQPLSSVSSHVQVEHLVGIWQRLPLRSQSLSATEALVGGFVINAATARDSDAFDFQTGIQELAKALQSQVSLLESADRLYFLDAFNGRPVVNIPSDWKRFGIPVPSDMVYDMTQERIRLDDAKIMTLDRIVLTLELCTTTTHSLQENTLDIDMESVSLEGVPVDNAALQEPLADQFGLLMGEVLASIGQNVDIGLVDESLESSTADFNRDPYLQAPTLDTLNFDSLSFPIDGEVAYPTTMTELNGYFATNPDNAFHDPPYEVPSALEDAITDLDLSGLSFVDDRMLVDTSVDLFSPVAVPGLSTQDHNMSLPVSPSPFFCALSSPKETPSVGCLQVVTYDTVREAVHHFKSWVTSAESNLLAIDRTPLVQETLGAAYLEEDWKQLFLEGADPDPDVIGLCNRADDVGHNICRRLNIPSSHSTVDSFSNALGSPVIESTSALYSSAMESRVSRHVSPASDNDVADELPAPVPPSTGSDGCQAARSTTSALSKTSAKDSSIRHLPSRRPSDTSLAQVKTPQAHSVELEDNRSLRRSKSRFSDTGGGAQRRTTAASALDRYERLSRLEISSLSSSNPKPLNRCTFDSAKESITIIAYGRDVPTCNGEKMSDHEWLRVSGELPFWKVKVTLAGAMRGNGRDFFAQASNRFSALSPQRRGLNLAFDSDKEYRGKQWPEIEDSLAKGTTIVVTNIKMDDVAFNEQTAHRLCKGNLVQVIDFTAEASSWNNLDAITVDVNYLANDACRDRNRVYSSLELPQESDFAVFPHSDEDVCEAAYLHRQNACRHNAGDNELLIDAKIRRCMRSAQISQEHSSRLPHVDATGFCTMTWLVEGEEIVWTHNVDAHSICDLRFGAYAAGDTCRGGLWEPVIQRKGDLITAGPAMIKATYTSADAIKLVKRFLIPKLFLTSMSVFVSTVCFGHDPHPSHGSAFLSAIQAHATLWRSCFIRRRKGLGDLDAVALRTMPDPVRDPNTAVRVFAALGCALIHTETLSMSDCAASQSSYLRSDRSSFGLIWWSSTLKGTISCSRLNSPTPYSIRLARRLGLSRSEYTDDDVTCGGMVDVAFHFAAALVSLAHRCNKRHHGHRGASNTSFPCRAAATVYERVVRSLAAAFTLDVNIVADVLGCIDRLHPSRLPADFNYDIFPAISWEPRDASISRAHLWSAVSTEKIDEFNLAPGSRYAEKVSACDHQVLEPSEVNELADEDNQEYVGDDLDEDYSDGDQDFQLESRPFVPEAKIAAPTRSKRCRDGDDSARSAIAERPRKKRR